MHKVLLVCLQSDADAVVASLHNAGVMHIEAPPGAACDQELSLRIDSEQERSQRLHGTIAFLKRFQAVPSAIPPKHLQADKLFERVYELWQQSETIDARIKELKLQIATLSPFGEFKENYQPVLQLGLVIKLAELEDIELVNIKNHAAYHLVGRAGYHNLVIILAAPNADVGVPTRDPPERPLPQLRAKLRELEAQSFAIKDDASRWAYQLRKLETLQETIEKDLICLAEQKKARTKDCIVGFAGYALHKDIYALRQALSRYCVALTIDEPTRDDRVPVMLKNPRMLRCFEIMVKTFTGIRYGEKDKTSLVAVLFMLFGSLCLLDAGYGAVLTVTGYVVALKVHRNFGQAFMWTGVCATLLGLACGRVFGLTFAKDILLNIPPILTLAIDPMVSLKFSLLVGVLAMVLTNLLTLYQNGLNMSAVGSMLAICGILTLAVRESGMLEGRFYDPVYLLNGVAVTFFSLCILSWLIFPEPVFGKERRLANTLCALYQRPLKLVLGIISHLRLFCTALLVSILALAINKICALLPQPLGLLFAPIGHLVIFMLALLSLYVHTNQLIFVEFGANCMSGGHHYFTPFGRRV